MIHRRALPLLLATPALAQTAPLAILGTGATERPIEALAQSFTRTTGRAVQAATGNGGEVAARIRRGDAADIVLNAATTLDGLIRDGFAHANSRRELGRMRLAVAVRRGATLLPMADEAALAVMLRAAPSIALSDAAAGATSGAHVLQLLQRLGVPAEAAGGPRLVPFARGLAAVQAVARGEVALVITQASEILAEPRATLVAPLPDSAQLVTPYVGAITTRAQDVAGAAAFLAFATGPEGAAAFRAVGFQVL